MVIFFYKFNTLIDILLQHLKYLCTQIRCYVSLLEFCMLHFTEFLLFFCDFKCIVSCFFRVLNAVLSVFFFLWRVGYFKRLLIAIIYYNIREESVSCLGFSKGQYCRIIVVRIRACCVC